MVKASAGFRSTSSDLDAVQGLKIRSGDLACKSTCLLAALLCGVGVAAVRIVCRGQRISITGLLWVCTVGSLFAFPDANWLAS